MNPRRIIGLLSFFLLLFSLLILLYSFLPSEMKVNRQNISPQDMELPRRNFLPFFTLLPLWLPSRKRTLALIFATLLILTSCATPTTESPKPTERPQPTAAPAATSAPTSPPLSTATSVPLITPTLIPQLTNTAAPQITVTPTKEPNSSGGTTVRPPESRLIELQYPVRLYLGDTPSITLVLKVSEDGTKLTPQATAAGGQVIASEPIKIENLYETHNVVALATVESLGLKVDHAPNWEQPLQAGQDLKWIWTVGAESEGVKSFKVLVSLRYVPKKEGETINKPIWVKSFDIEVSKYLWLPLSMARTFGVIGFVGGGIGSIIGFPLAKEILSWLWARFVPKPKKKKPTKDGRR